MQVISITGAIRITYIVILGIIIYLYNKPFATTHKSEWGDLK